MTGAAPRQNKVFQTGSWGAVALGASIPASIALDNVFLAIVLFTWLIGGQLGKKLNVPLQNPVYRAATLLFGVLLLGSLYGPANWSDVRLHLSKYLELALLPAMGWYFLAQTNRSAGLRVFAGSLFAVLVLSFAFKAGLLPPNPWMHGSPETPLVFKLRLTHNILMAFAAFVFAWFALSATSRRSTLLWTAAAVLAVINVTLMIDGVTGYLVLGALTLLLGWQHARFKGVGATLASAALALGLLMVVPSAFQTRTQQVIEELRREDAAKPATTSAGFRMEFYRNTLALIARNPVFGNGTGSFPALYAEQVKGSGSVATRNPHNEFMLLTVQTGIFGLGAFLWLLWQQWRYAPLLPTPMERGLARGLVIMMIIVCLLNSALLDHTEGLLYAWLTALLYAGLPPAKKSGTQP